MLQNLSIKIFSENHLQAAAHLFTKCFIILNPFWKQCKQLPFNDIQAIMRGKIIKALQIDQQLAIFDGNKLISVGVNLDLVDYIKTPPMPNNLELFKKLSKVAQELEGSIDLSQTKRGEALFAAFGAVDQDYANQGFSFMFTWLSIAIMKASGYKTYYARSTNVYSRKMIQRLGGEVIKEYEYQDGDIKNKCWLLKIDLADFKFPYSRLKRIMQSKKQQKREKKLQPKL